MTSQPDVAPTLFGSKEQVALLQRGADLRKLTRHDRRFFYYGRTVGICTLDAAPFDCLAALARLQIDHTRMSQTFYRPAAPAEAILVTKAIEQHDGMIAAIEARDTKLATDLTLQHWDLSRDRLERFVRPDPLPVQITASKEKSHAV